MQTANPWRAQLSFLIPFFAFGFALAMTVAFLWTRPAAAGPDAEAPPPELAVAAVPATPADAEVAADQSAAQSREPATPPPAAVRSFEQRVDDLARIGQRAPPRRPTNRRAPSSPTCSCSSTTRASARSRCSPRRHPRPRSRSRTGGASCCSSS